MDELLPRTTAELEAEWRRGLLVGVSLRPLAAFAARVLHRPGTQAPRPVPDRARTARPLNT
jgi:hypothetical protein